MSRADLKREAAAWCRLARLCAESDTFTIVFDAPDELLDVVRLRLDQHTVLASHYIGYHSPANTTRVLMCLLMALECEDESRAR